MYNHLILNQSFNKNNAIKKLVQKNILSSFIFQMKKRGQGENFPLLTAFLVYKSARELTHL